MRCAASAAAYSACACPQSAEQAAAVAIVGAGPTGLTLSALLSQYGVPSVLLEQVSSSARPPTGHLLDRMIVMTDGSWRRLAARVAVSCKGYNRSAILCWLQAHFINNRTMEVFRQMRAGEGAGATLASRVAEASPPSVGVEEVRLLRDRDGEGVRRGGPFQGRVRPVSSVFLATMPTGAVFYHTLLIVAESLPCVPPPGPEAALGRPAVSPEPVAHLSQHRLLPLLLSCAAGPQAKVICDSVHFGQRVSAATQSGGSVLITASDMQVTTYWCACPALCWSPDVAAFKKQQQPVHYAGSLSLYTAEGCFPGLLRPLRATPLR